MTGLFDRRNFHEGVDDTRGAARSSGRSAQNRGMNINPNLRVETSTLALRLTERI